MYCRSAGEYRGNLLILDPVNYPAMSFSRAASLCSQLGLAIPSRTEEKDMIVQAANNSIISDFVWFRMLAEPFGLRRVFLDQGTASREDLHNVACASKYGVLCSNPMCYILHVCWQVI